jgi:hypothetical protein
MAESLTLTEEYDCTLLYEILRNTSNEDVSAYVYALISAADHGIQHVKYEWKTVLSGRLYAQYPSFQQAPGAVRRQILPPSSNSDIDIVNCFFTLIAEVASKEGLDTPSLQDYNSNREQRHTDIARVCGTSIAMVKQFMLTMLHGGDIALYTDLYDADSEPYVSLISLMSDIDTQWTYDLKRELLEIYTYLAPLNSEVYAIASNMAATANSTNVMGRFMHIFLSRIENACIDALRHHFKSQSIETKCLMFDGLVIGYPEEHKLDLTDAEHAIKSATGFSVRLTRKSLAPTEKDSAYLYAKNTVILPTSAVDIKYDASQWVKPYHKTERKCLMIAAPMGTGKTHQTVKYIEYVMQDPNCRVIMICCRMLMAQYFKGLLQKSDVNLNLQFYSEATPYKYQDQGTVLIIEYESLHRLFTPKDGQSACVRFNHVIIDEAVTLMSTIVSGKTNGSNLLFNYHIIAQLMRSSTRTVLLDADMFITDQVTLFLGNHFDPIEVAAIVYNKKPTQKTFICYDEKRHRSVWQETFFEAIRNRRDTPETHGLVVLICRTKSAVDAWEILVNEHHPGFKEQIMIVTRDTPRVAMERFTNINQYIGDNKLILMITTTRMAGAADIKGPEAGHAASFLDMTGFSGADVRTLMQATGRTREVANNTVHVLVPAIQRTKAGRVEHQIDIRKTLTQREGLRMNILKHSAAVEIDPSNPERLTLRTTTPPALLDIVAGCVQDDQRNMRSRFIGTLCSWVTSKGHKILLYDTEDLQPSQDTAELEAEARAQNKRARADAKAAFAEAEERILLQIQSSGDSISDLERRLAFLRSEDAADGLGQEDQITCHLIGALLKMPSLWSTADIGSVRYVMKNGAMLYMTYCLQELSSEQLHAHESRGLSRAQLLAECGLMSTVIPLIEEILLFGGMAEFTRCDDYTFNAKKVAEDAGTRGKLDNICKHMRGLSGTQRKSQAKGTGHGRLVSELNVFVKQFGLMLRRRPRDRASYMYNLAVVPGLLDILPVIRFRSIHSEDDSKDILLAELKRRDNEYQKVAGCEFEWNVKRRRLTRKKR